MTLDNLIDAVVDLHDEFLFFYSDVFVGEIGLGLLHVGLTCGFVMNDALQTGLGLYYSFLRKDSEDLLFGQLELECSFTVPIIPDSESAAHGHVVVAIGKHELEVVGTGFQQYGFYLCLYLEVEGVLLVDDILD